MEELLKKAEINNEALKGRYLTFLIDKETFGIEVRCIKEIVGIQAITEIPEMPDYMKGIINLRGIIIPVMDARVRFNKNTREYDNRTCVIVIEYNNISSGLIVDSVSEVMTILDDVISERPDICSGDSHGYVKNIGRVSDSVILLLDCGKLLGN